MCLTRMYTCEMQRGLRWRAAGDLTTTSERSREVDAVCRFTVSSAVSPVGPDLVVCSVAERERVSPQRARFEGAVRVPRIASSCQLSSRCPIPPTRGACPFGGSSLGHSVEWGMPAVRMCVLLSDPPCYVRLIILSHTTHTMIHDKVTSATG